MLKQRGTSGVWESEIWFLYLNRHSLNWISYPGDTNMRWARVVSLFMTFGMVGTSLGFLLYSSPIAISGDQTPEVSAYNPVIDSIVQNVSLQSLYRYNYDLQNFSSRYLLAPELNLSADYIYSEYAANPGVVVESQYFMYNGNWVRNIIATIPAFNNANATTYILGGHYDSYSNSNPMATAPGADDDGSGTAAAMEAARVLSGYKLNATVVLAAWTAEEFGLHGARFYAKEAKRTGMDIGGMIQLDMIGYDPNSLMGLRAVSNAKSAWLLNEFWESNQDYSIGLNMVTAINPTARSSDHAPFWDEGYPAIFSIETDFSAFYHSPQDTVDKMNFELVTRTTKTAVATIAKIAGVMTPGNGVIVLDKTSYNPSDLVEISLYDTDLNTNPGSAESVQVNIRSSAESGGEQVTLTEVAPDDGVFKGTIPLTTAVSIPGQLTVFSSDALNATYMEASPAGLRWVNADVDGVLPLISNVAVVPSVTTATITWDTNEDADSLVNYGLTTGLGSSESDWPLIRSHSIRLGGLSPGTQYFFDVTSIDLAGNMAFDDNGGAKYSFVTLTGSSTVPAYGYVGWVREEEPTGNHFTDPEILVGYSNFRQTSYIGAAQFQVNPIPVGATITNATLQLYGGRWIYDDVDYQWTVSLLNSSIDSNWVNHAYGNIDTAGTDLVLTPVLDDVDLVEGEWNSLHFQPSEYALLRQHFNNSMISFRVNGPESGIHPAGLIFAWVSGYESGSSFASPFSPRLTVTYSMTGDNVGPDTINPQVSRENGAGDPLLVLTATSTDIGRGDSNITNVEYYINTDPGPGSGIPMTPLDGSYDSPVEDTIISIDVSGWTPSGYTFYFRGRDEAGNWGLPIQLEVYITPPLPPSNVDAILEGSSLENVNITWTLSLDDGQGDDDIDHYAVYSGTTYDKSGESYSYLGSVPAGTDYFIHALAGDGDPNSHYYIVLANETFGNVKRADNQAGKFARTLVVGVHLISNPLAVADANVISVLQTVQYNRVWQYDPFATNPWANVDATKPYGGSFVTTNEMAFWVRVTSPCIYAVAGKVPDLISVDLRVGWNLVGYSSLIPRDVAETLMGIGFSTIEGYDGLALPYNLKQMSDWDYLYAGYGYWIFASMDTTWELTN
jgi:hypothetical protein